jgi:hypothetical protein
VSSYICKSQIFVVECIYGLLFQIASLKATIARMKGGELEHFKQPSNRIIRGRKLPRDYSSSIEVT